MPAYTNEELGKIIQDFAESIDPDTDIDENQAIATVATIAAIVSNFDEGKTLAVLSFALAGHMARSGLTAEKVDVVLEHLKVVSLEHMNPTRMM